jgi:hypothetical protein
MYEAGRLLNFSFITGQQPNKHPFTKVIKSPMIANPPSPNGVVRPTLVVVNLTRLAENLELIRRRYSCAKS